MGKIKKALTKINSKIARETLIKMLINTLIENRWYQSINDINIIDISKDGAIIEMRDCSRKKMFKNINNKINKPFNLDYFCENCCIPEFKYYLEFINLTTNFEITPTGCIITAQWKSDVIKEKIKE